MKFGFGISPAQLTINKQHVYKYLDNIKGSVLEVLAKKMPEKEAEYLANKWGYFSPKFKSDTEFVPNISVKKDNNIEIKPEKDIQFSIARNTKDINIFHPFFGELLTDLTYKKVYLTSISNLIRAPIWEKQRILRPNRVDEIIKSKKQNGTENLIPGVITFFSNKSNGDCGIIDGQHRAAALILQATSENWKANNRNVLVDVFEIDSDKEIEILFKEINSGESVRLVDMPNEMLPYERDILEEAVALIVEKYFLMFKTSNNCKIPHLHIDTFRDDIYQSGMIRKYSLNTAQKLYEHLSSINSKLEKRPDSMWMEIVGESISHSKAVKKARKFNFFLGLDKSWTKV